MNSTSTQTRVTVTVSGNTGNVVLGNTATHVRDGHPGGGQVSKVIEDAVFAHIQALRSLGKTTANTASIAAALGLPRAVVEQAVARLSDRGVKRTK